MRTIPTMILVSCLVAAASAAEPAVRVSARPDGAESPAAFPCKDRVYAQATFPADAAPGPHKLAALWVRPDGTVQEHTKLDVALPAAGPKTATLWLQFEEKRKSIFDEFVFGGDYGADASPFQGRWTVKVLLDGKKVGEARFEVSCVD
jgi:hypothetical protein